jgi:hypothetical protein
MNDSEQPSGDSLTPDHMQDVVRIGSDACGGFIMPRAPAGMFGMVTALVTR